MQAKLDSDDGKAKCTLRKQTIEPVFGIITSALGFVRFHLRGLDKVKSEWTLVAIACNCRHITNLRTD